ncbi:hypothetical protein KAJ61_04215 [Candidatus Parcubacteria bacterium]|nr:hypothetical protein [Candidatus Parcubacteria bacterium]
MSELNKLLQKIGIAGSEYLLRLDNKQWKRKVPYRLQKGLENEIKPDAFLVQENKLLILFFDFTKGQHDNEKELFEKIWNLGGVPAVYVIKDNDIEIYNGFSFNSKKSICFEKLIKKNGEKVTDKNTSFWDILSGKLWRQLPDPKNQVDEKLLKNIEDAQKALRKNGLDFLCANNIIGRLLFTRYLIDREVKIKYFENEEVFLTALKNKNKKLLYEFFEYLKITFNGDLFPISDEEKKQINDKHLKILFDFFNGTEIESGQQSLFKIYNFKIIPVELISEVYERFMGKEKQRKEGAYYTPSFLVDYILEKTVKRHLEKNNFCRIFDPSCGSGIFLVETLRCIIEKNLSKNGKISKDKLIKIVKDNIFGVDKDESAINLSSFSICLTLLDYIEPKDITNFRFEKLKNRNLFAEDFFNTKHSFNKKIKDLNFILGNPPWGSDKEKKEYSLHIQYIKSKELPVSDKQFAQSFTLRIKDFSSKKTKCALVLHSKILYNHNANKFRKYWLENFYINEVLELSPVRNQLFSKATAPTTIVFYQYEHGEKIKNKIVTHTSIKPNIFLKYLKILVIEKNDTKKIKQEYFQKHDWLWKVMLYGNAFDFYFIKRLKDNYLTLNKTIKEYKLTKGQGLQVDGGDKNSATHLLGKLYLDTRNVSQFFISNKNLKKWDTSVLHRPRKKELFESPYILLKKGFSKKDFSMIAAYSEKDYIFTDSITAIKGENKDILKNITGILNSLFASYYFLQQGSSAGVEREQGHNEKDRFTIPIKINKKISQKVDEIQELYRRLNREYFNDQELKINIQKTEKQLNVIVLNSFEVSSFEKRLIDYVTKISIPLLNNDEAPIKNAAEMQLKNYAQIFLDHFGFRWNGNPDFFEIDIYFNNYIAGMNFKVVKEKRNEVVKIIKNLEKTEELFELMKLGEKKYTDRFYKQRDIRGFEKTSFYIVKPSQYKNWHPAVAQADLHEFVEAIMKSGMKKFKDN